MRKPFRFMKLACVISMCFGSLSTVALAGPGAVINSCIFSLHKPQQPITVDFKVTGTSWLRDDAKGNDATLTVTNAGVTCVSSGYVESNAPPSEVGQWRLQYSTSSGTGGNAHISLDYVYAPTIGIIPIMDEYNYAVLLREGTSPNTQFCVSPSLCKGNPWPPAQKVFREKPVDGGDATRPSWPKNTQGPIFLIFSP